MAVAGVPGVGGTSTGRCGTWDRSIMPAGVRVGISCRVLTSCSQGCRPETLHLLYPSLGPGLAPGSLLKALTGSVSQPTSFEPKHCHHPLKPTELLNSRDKVTWALHRLWKSVLQKASHSFLSLFWGGDDDDTFVLKMDSHSPGWHLKLYVAEAGLEPPAYLEKRYATPGPACVLIS